MEDALKLSTLLFLTFITLPVVAYSHEAKMTSAYDKCITRAGAIDPEILECMSAEFLRQDKRLNAAYQKLISVLSPNQKKGLQEAQRFWVKYTEANCAFYYNPDGGTSARQSANQCEIDARASRAKELEDLRKHY